jgi:hypothetical protein
MLFARRRPAGLTPSSSAADIFAAYERVAPSQALMDQNLKAIQRLLMSRHRFRLSPGDLQGIEFVYRSWVAAGPELHYELNNGGGFGRSMGFPTYAELMTAADASGRNRSYLATEDSFRFVKDLETRNMVLPVVGNFGGSKALRAVAAYLKKIGATVSVFYVSNVEQYLREDGIWGNFCANVSALPLDRWSTFFRSVRGGFGGRVRFGPGFPIQLDPMMADGVKCGP